jgi:hypothetical protein
MTINLKSLPVLFLVLGAGVASADAPKPTAAAKPTADATAAPATTCFELSKDGKSWSRTPELLCVGSGDKNVEITLKTGLPTPIEVATFHFDLKSRVRCIDCNKDEFALTNAENSIFNTLAIKFDGKRDVKAGTETGSVSIGKTSFHYRRTK